MSNTNHNRREFLKLTAGAAAGLGCLSLGLKARPLATTRPFFDEPNTHNMMVVGSKTAFISHLPMFDKVSDEGTEFTSPHRRQVIMEATFAKDGVDVTETYLKDRLKNPGVKMYTLKPAEFVLGRVDPNGEALKTFRGKGLFRGHLERRPHNVIIGVDGDNPAEGVFDVNVKNVVHFHKFDPKGTKPAKLEYILFGKGSETFMAHFITKPSDFDQIVSVKITGHSFTDAELGSGLHVVFSGRDNTALTRMKEKDKGSGEFQIPGATPQMLNVEVTREFYFEETELAVRPSFGQSKEEVKSGFPG
jgi:hypothetical protein